MLDLNHRPPAWQLDALTTRPQRPGFLAFFFRKIWQNCMLAPPPSRVGVPSCRRSWICPQPEIIFCTILIVFTSRRDALQQVERAEHLRLTDTGLCVGNPAGIIQHLIQSYIPLIVYTVPALPPKPVADLQTTLYIPVSPPKPEADFGKGFIFEIS